MRMHKIDNLTATISRYCRLFRTTGGEVASTSKQVAIVTVQSRTLTVI